MNINHASIGLLIKLYFSLFLEVFGEEISEEEHVLRYVTENISESLSSYERNCVGYHIEYMPGSVRFAYL